MKTPPLTEPDEEQLTQETEVVVGTTSWTEYGMAPVINGITPSAVPLGSSGTFDIAGLNLNAGGTDSSPTVSGGGSGLTLTNVQVTDPDGYALSVDYRVDSNTTTLGTHAITVTTTSGTSNQYNITVGDPTPVITGINPGSQANPWQAGATYTCGFNPIQITGTGFGTDTPMLSLSGTGIGAPSVCSGNSDTAIAFGISISASAPTETVGVTVTSAGYQGYGSNMFSSGGGNSSSSNAMNAYVDAEPVVVQIMFNGNNVANNAAPPCPDPTNGACVVVGQQILLTASLTQNGQPVQLQSQSWDQPPGSITGGFTIETTTSPPRSGQAVAMPGTANCQTLQGNCLMFYWVEAGAGSVTRTVNYHYTIAGQPRQTVPATFQVTAPTNVAVQVPTGLVNIASSSPVNNAGPQIVYGGQRGNIGIIFNPALTAPQGP